jgi:hypothetical protein
MMVVDAGYWVMHEAAGRFADAITQFAMAGIQKRRRSRQ